MANKIELTTDRTKLKNNADQKPATKNDGTNALVSKIIKTLITNIKSPKVKIVTGSVRRVSIGFTNAFRTPRTIAAKSAVPKLGTLTPGTT